MNKEISLNKFKPRPYQLKLIKAFEQEKYKRLLVIWPRRAGKDFTSFNILLRAALKRVATYYIVLPTFSQGRRVIWDAITNDGERFMDFIPKELIQKTNEQQMKITLINSSVIQIVGSDNYDALVGVNLGGAIFSEYALQDPRGYQFLRPVLTANEGWAIFISTPRGKNSLWELYQIAKQHPDWWISHLTVEETSHIPLDLIEKERNEGLMSEDLIQQEYYCSFDMGVEGSYYAKYIDKLRLEHRISVVPWEPSFQVHTAWDIGVRDATTIIFFQQIGQTIRIIDCYENAKQGLEHYAHILSEKPYTYGRHIAPHDIAVKEFGSGMTRIDKARHLGIKFTIAPSLSIMDGIEQVRTVFGRLWIDQQHAGGLIKALENYRQEWDAKRKVYKPHPLHDASSHWADAMRYLAISLPKLKDSITQEDIDRKYKEKLYGADLPKEFMQPKF
jgi:phage terminase large subunit